MNIADYLFRLIGLIMAMFINYALTDRRYSSRKTILWFTAGTAALAVLNWGIWYFAGTAFFTRVYPLTINFASYIFLLFFSRQRWITVAFNVLTAIQICAVIAITSSFCASFFTGNTATIVELSVRIIIGIPLIFLIYRYFRPAYMAILHSLKRGWGLLCIMPLSFYTIFYILFMRGAVAASGQLLFIVALVLVIMAAAYGVIFIFFREYIQRASLQEEQQMLKTQVLALERQTGAIRRSEEQVRIYRHDMRHYIGDVAALLREGNIEEALRVLGDFDERNKRTELPRYCQNATVNAILTLYFGQAMDAGIKVEADCSVPETLPVESTELAMVLANAVENAIHACDKLPKGTQKRISVRVMAVPHLVLEVANTYDGQVQLDEQGLPVSKEEGHGIGTKSILAFVDKYDGVLSYKPDDTMFRLRLMVSNP